MHINQARAKKTRLRAGGVVLMISAGLFFVCTGIKSVYFSLDNDVSALSTVSRGIQRLLYLIYENTQRISWVWERAPVIDPSVLLGHGNLGALLIFIVFAIGRIMWDSAALLSKRIKEAEELVQSERWRRDLQGQQGQVSVARTDVLEINIELDQKDQWYKRPLGLLVLTLVGGVLVAWLNLKLGLAKL
jgi:hypothetical protein